jgi:RNA polymerase sigma factor (sigma-70 family)
MLELGICDDLRLAQKGDRQALDRFLAMLHPHLVKMVWQYGRQGFSPESTADLVQESCLRIWLRLHQFQGRQNRGQTSRMFWEWASQIVRRLVLDSHRRRNAQCRKPPRAVLRLAPANRNGTSNGKGWIDPAAGGPGPAANVRAGEEARLVQEALEKISDEKDRKILHLSFFDELSFRQIAGQLNVTYTRVQTGYHRGLRQLERDLGSLL